MTRVVHFGALRDDTLAEIGLDSLRRKLARSQAGIVAELATDQLLGKSGAGNIDSDRLYATACG